MKTVKSSKILFVLAVLGGIALAAGPAAAQTTVVQFDGSSTYDLTTLQSVELNFVSPAPLVLDAAYGVPTLTSNALYTAVNNTPINGTWTTGGGGNGLFVLEGNAALVFSTATTTLTNTAGTTYTVPQTQYATAAGGPVVFGGNAVAAAVQDGANGATSGIVSTAAQASGGAITVGFYDNSNSAFSTFGPNNTPVSSASELVAATYVGDPYFEGINGVLDGDGYEAWVAGAAILASGNTIPASQLWQYGDYLHEGPVGISDGDGYEAWVAEYAQAVAGTLPALPSSASGVSASFAAASPASSHLAAVPEPSTFILLGAALAAYALARLRRR